MHIIKIPSAWMVYLPATEEYPAKWVNAAAIEEAIFEPDEPNEPPIMTVIYQSGRVSVFYGLNASVLHSEFESLSRGLKDE